jgi:hypothetical protein
MKSFLDVLSDLFARAARDRRLSRGEQIGVVMVSHIGIFVVVFLIQAAFMDSDLPTGFIVGEVVIIGLCLLLSARFPELQAWFQKALRPKPRRSSSNSGNDAARKKEESEQLAAIALILAFVAQFAALGFLLWGTGGPIESPYAELTLAIAVFTPFIANEPYTVVSVVGASIAYYALLILCYSETHDLPKLVVGLDRPSDWSYFFVNVTILIGAITFTIYESLARSWQAAQDEEPEISEFATGNGDPPVGDSDGRELAPGDPDDPTQSPA